MCNHCAFKDNHYGRRFTVCQESDIVEHVRRRVDDLDAIESSARIARESLQTILKKEVSQDAGSVQEAISEASAILTSFVGEEDKVQEIRKFDRIPEAGLLDKVCQHLSSLRVNIVLAIVSLFLIVHALSQPAAVAN